MDRWEFIASGVLGLLTAPLAANGQTGGNVRRVGYLAPGASDPA
jgi:hypothetical protein